jgi:hypothetical protein
MSNYLSPALLAVFVGAGAFLAGTDAVVGQERPPFGQERTPSVTPAFPGLPPAPQPTSRLPQGPPGGSSNYAVSAAANEHGSFLWVVDNIQHIVTLCEKTDSKDFSCTKKPLP